MHAIAEIGEAALVRYGLDADANLAVLPAAARRAMRCLTKDVDVRVPFRVEVGIGDPANLLSRASRNADVVLIGRARGTNACSLSANITDIIGAVDCPALTFHDPHVRPDRIFRLRLPGTAWALERW